MALLDSSQLEFCRSTESNIRLLAPAGCGKTSSLLYRCRSLVCQASGSPRFLIITFTNAAAEEVKDQQANDPEFESLQDKMTVTTLNALGWGRIRSRVNNARLLKSSNDRHFAVLNQLRPVWRDKAYIVQAVQKRGRNARTLLDVMDNLKSMGFDHTVDTNLDKFQERVRNLRQQGAFWRIQEQFDLLTGLGILESHTRNSNELASQNTSTFNERFFTFWRVATETVFREAHE